MALSAGLRHRIIHEYEEIDDKIVYKKIENYLDNIKSSSLKAGTFSLVLTNIYLHCCFAAGLLLLNQNQYHNLHLCVLVFRE
ncbi:MAG: HepT-like ribonuclease domain-containing protein [Bacillota bacterium]